MLEPKNAGAAPKLLDALSAEYDAHYKSAPRFAQKSFATEARIREEMLVAGNLAWLLGNVARPARIESSHAKPWAISTRRVPPSAFGFVGIFGAAPTEAQVAPLRGRQPSARAQAVVDGAAS